jgi:hypothetical protein
MSTCETIYGLFCGSHTAILAIFLWGVSQYVTFSRNMLRNPLSCSLTGIVEGLLYVFCARAVLVFFEFPDESVIYAVITTTCWLSIIFRQISGLIRLFGSIKYSYDHITGTITWFNDNTVAVNRRNFNDWIRQMDTDTLDILIDGMEHRKQERQERKNE